MSKLAEEVMDYEYDFRRHGTRKADDPRLPWMPFQPASFIGYIWESMPLIKGSFFLEVGCGPGTKMRIADEMFGLDPHGIEYDKAMAQVAGAYGQVIEGDALSDEWVGEWYRQADIVWLYRPFRDPDLERQLEDRVIGAMKPGAILAGGAWETEVPDLGWNIVVDEWDFPMRHGAWQKPVTE
jgi:hypothetical protein